MREAAGRRRVDLDSLPASPFDHDGPEPRAVPYVGRIDDALVEQLETLCALLVDDRLPVLRRFASVNRARAKARAGGSNHGRL